LRSEEVGDKATYEELERRLRELETEAARRRKAEQALGESEERFREFVELLPENVCETDAAGNILFTNRRAFRVFGYTEEDLKRGLNALDMMIPEDRPRAMANIEKVLRGEELGGRQYTALTKDGSTFPVVIYANPVVREGVPAGLRVIIADITNQKRAEEELHRYKEHLEELVEERTVELKQEILERMEIEERFRKLNEDLEKKVRERTQKLEKAYEDLKKLDEMKDAFLSSVSHEPRTPLTSIRSFSEILLRYQPDDPETRTEFIDIINSESERLTRLINDLLDLSRIEAGKMVWNDHLLSLREVIDHVAKAHGQLLQDKSLKLTLDIPDHLPPVLADQDRIHQVLTNLLGNAIKFSSDGGKILIKGEVYLDGESPNGSEWVRIRVADHGVGIEEKDFEAIFDRFRQVSKDSLRDKPRGTGLGLPITREIIEHYGGRVWVESTNGKGSTFFFILPTAGAAVSPGEAAGRREARRTRDYTP
jgi:PAS domain S-box-containing protein